MDNNVYVVIVCDHDWIRNPEVFTDKDTAIYYAKNYLEHIADIEIKKFSYPSCIMLKATESCYCKICITELRKEIVLL